MRPLRRGRLRSVLLVASVVPWAGWPGAHAAPAPASAARAGAEAAKVTTALAATARIELLDVHLNGALGEEGVRVHRLRDGQLALPEALMAGWNLRPPAGEPLWLSGQAYRRVSDWAGVGARLDEAQQALHLSAAPAAFLPTAVAFGDARDARAAPDPRPAVGAYLNYDVFAQHQQAAGAPGSRVGGALFELGGFRGDWQFQQTGHWRLRPSGLAAAPGSGAGAGAGSRWVRLDTTLSWDRPGALASLRLGDVVGHGGAWGRALRLAGVQWSTNPALQPGRRRLAAPLVRGEAAVPSTVDLVIDNVRQAQVTVPAGPFELPGLPVASGAGTVQVVVRDLLGREQVLVQPYFVNAGLLAPGEQDLALEAGRLRRDYGGTSNAHGPALAAATVRRGLSAGLTGELRAELMARQQTAGLAMTWRALDRGTLSPSVVASRSANGGGLQLALAGDHVGPRWSLQARAVWSSAGFVQAGGTALGSGATRLLATAGVGWSLPMGSFSLNHLVIDTWGGERLQSSTVQVARSLGPWGQWALVGTRQQGRASSQSLGVFLMHPLGDDTAVTASAGQQRVRVAGAAPTDPAVAAPTPVPAGERRTQSVAWQVERGAPTGVGLGYRLVQEAGTLARRQADVQWNGEALSAQAGVAQAAGSTAVRVGVSGGVALMPEGALFGRRIDGAFAVVQVDGLAGVRVSRDHQVVARTDARGLALVSGLRGHEANRIGLDPADLPMDVQVDALQAVVVPGTRSGVSARFAVRRNRAVTLKLVLADGRAVPVGSHIELVEGSAQAQAQAQARAQTQYPVGLGGKVFLVGLGDHNRVVVRWSSHQCTAELALGPVDVGLPDLGTRVCHLVAA